MQPLNLYLLELTEAGSRKSPTYDVIESMVVRAFHARSARRLANTVCMNEGTIWTDTDLVEITKLGRATHGRWATEAIICKNCHNG